MQYKVIFLGISKVDYSTMEFKTLAFAEKHPSIVRFC